MTSTSDGGLRGGLRVSSPSSLGLSLERLLEVAHATGELLLMISIFFFFAIKKSSIQIQSLWGSVPQAPDNLPAVTPDVLTAPLLGVRQYSQSKSVLMLLDSVYSHYDICHTSTTDYCRHLKENSAWMAERYIVKVHGFSKKQSGKYNVWYLMKMTRAKTLHSHFAYHQD